MEEKTGVLHRAASAYKGWPLWGRIAAPVVATVVGIAALGSTAEDEPIEIDAVADVSSSTTTTAAEEVDIAVLITAVPHGFGTADMEAIVIAACDELGGDDTAEAAAKTFAVIDASVDGLTGEQVGGVVDALEDVVPEACPDGVAEHPDFLRELASLAPAPATTTTAAPPVTAPPTTLPPTTLPPTTVAPPPPPPAGPSTSYKNCSEAKAAGAAPVYRGDPGYGSHLDRDDDGVGCET